MNSMQEIFLGGAIGGLMAFVLSLPAVAFELFEHGRVRNVPLLVDVKTLGGKKLSPLGVFFAGLLLHLVIGFLFGAIYPIFVQKGWLVITHAPYTFLSLLVYAIGAWIIVGALIFPVLQFGWFGRRQGKRVWLEMLVSMLLIGMGMWLCVRYYQPMYF